MAEPAIDDKPRGRRPGMQDETRFKEAMFLGRAFVVPVANLGKEADEAWQKVNEIEDEGLRAFALSFVAANAHRSLNLTSLIGTARQAYLIYREWKK